MVDPTPDGILAALRELVSALDRRVPHIERTDEILIARDAQILRRKAVARIEELQRGDVYDLVGAIMTDDGGRLPERDDARY